MPETAVVVPTYNERDNVVGLLPTVLAAIDCHARRVTPRCRLALTRRNVDFDTLAYACGRWLAA